ncbi:hypothetical protein [Flavobacterium cellulosilyticum]|uniref:Nicotinate-nucleotide adenylyltransferase n=1 Tax=Flavobacterium cellulosilyticum TaxID=2541731 RepID=A0A4R5C305_9FLAO|nr:hypothetical protein [Flavobacterium cellulosilyticum]TDD94031.1 hypothetical protein E0F76_18035 [Flavobacterium cellulosilyticum]
MKSIIKVILLSLITTIGYSQDKKGKNLEKINLSEVVIKNTGRDISTYVRDMHVDPRVTRLQNAFLEFNFNESLKGYDIVKNKESYGSYVVLIELVKGEGKLKAIYNENGKLMSVVEKYENIQLPNSLCHSIYKEYPGWQIVKDKYKYAQEFGKNIKKEYKITMTKDNKTKKITVVPEDTKVAIR